MLHGKMQACEQIFEIPLVTFGTAVLLFSSFFVVLALNGAQTGQPEDGCSAGSPLTVIGGLFFIGMQVYEFYHFVHKGLGYSTNLFGVQLLHADRVPRQPRDGRRDLALHGADPGHPRASCRRRSRSTSRSRRCTGTSWTWSGS